MATQTTRTLNSVNPSAQPSSRPREWSKPRNGEPGSAFLAVRGRGARGGRGGGRPPSSPTTRDSKLTLEIHGSQSDISTPKAKPPPVRKGSTQSVTPSATSDKPPSSTDRASQSKTPPRRTRGVPAVIVAPASPTPDSAQNVPLTPSRTPGRRRRPPQHTKPPTNGTSKPNTSLHPQKSKTPSIAPRKDVPPHLAAAHEAEIRHGIDALVERVRAVAMAENRPSTPGSHIDWAGDEDDSLPDLDDWGVTTANTSTFDKEEEISPILADALRPLPEPQTEGGAEDQEEQHVEPSGKNDDDDGIKQNSLSPSPLSDTSVVQYTSVTTTVGAHEVAAVSEAIIQTRNLSPHLSLPARPVVAIENPRASPAPVSTKEGSPAIEKEGLSQSIHAPSEVETPEERTLSSSGDHGLSASIHAPKSLPESRSAPSLLNPGASSPARTFSPSHGRSKTEGRGAFPHSRATPASAINQRAIRSGTSSPLGPHPPAHGRNHSTPTGVAGQRTAHNARPVITGEAMSRLARTIMPAIPRAQSVAVAKE